MKQETLFFLDAQRSSFTGLIESFHNSSKYLYSPAGANFTLIEEGYLGKQCFTYDQALAVIAYTLLGEFEKARHILDLLSFNFHIGKGNNIGLFNSYKTDGLCEDGKTLIMGIDGDRIHAGPNLWLGLACFHCTLLSKDSSFLPLCLEIIKWSIHKLQHYSLKDGQRGGISMGFGWGANWQQVYSTENNVDYYALLNLLEYSYSEHSFTRDAFVKAGLHLHEIQREKNGIKRWLREVVYNTAEGYFYAGFNENGIDVTKALDTTTFTILSFGIPVLREMGIDPELLIANAEKFLKVEIIIKDKKFCGFDFTDNKILATNRSPLIWIEGTYQMILTYKIMAKYFHDQGDLNKFNYYQDKTNEYLTYMNSLIGTLDAEFHIPSYASANPTDKDIIMTFRDEWELPRGDKGQYVPALVSSVWRLMCFMNFNPMSENSFFSDQVK